MGCFLFVFFVFFDNWNCKRKKECHYRKSLYGRAREVLQANGKPCYPGRTEGVVQVSECRKEEVSIGLIQQDMGPEGLLESYDRKNYIS